MDSPDFERAKNKEFKISVVTMGKTVEAVPLKRLIDSNKAA